MQAEAVSSFEAPNYILCPKCKARHLPLEKNEVHQASGVYQASCVECGHSFKFKSVLMPKDSMSISVNGTTYNVPNTYHPTTSLNDYLRDVLHLTGTKVMCHEGGCGCCIVSVTYADVVTNSNKTVSINSCLCPLYICDGWQITTTEGLGNAKDGFHEIQQRLASAGGSQCGYCSPGMVMNMYGFLQNNPKPTKQQIEDAFDGNICRCTGFRPILDAMKSFAADAPKSQFTGPIDIEELNRAPFCKRTGGLCRNHGHCPTNGTCKSESIHMVLQDNVQWYKPSTLQEVYSILKTHKDTGYRLVVGNTSRGVYKGQNFEPAMIDIRGVPDLLAHSLSPLTIGACVTLSDMIIYLNLASQNNGYKYCGLLAEHISKVANLPVRNAASWGGNLVMKQQYPEFPSDILCCLTPIGPNLQVADENGKISAVGVESFLSLDMKGKLLVGMSLPTFDDDVYIRTYKAMPRSQNAHAYVNAGFRMRLDKSKSYTVQDQPCLFYGGISSKFIRATQTEKYLVGKQLADNSTIQGALAILKTEVQTDTSGGLSSPSYRLSLTQTLFYRFVLDVCSDKVSDRFKSGATSLLRPVSSGQQSYDTNKSEWPVTFAMPKRDSAMQAAGEVEYVSDIQLPYGDLFAVFVKSTVSNGDIDKIDATKALSMPGVVKFIQASDIPGHNTFLSPAMGAGTVEVEEALCSGKVLFYGQPLGIIVADTEQHAHSAAYGGVTITYKNTTKPILNMDDAIAAGSMFTSTMPDLVVGNAESAISNSTKKVTGKVYMGHQYHFHVETQECKAVPKEGCMKVYPSTQWVDGVQKAVADVLGLENSQVDVEVRRLGGAFGGKISRNNQISTACALAAFLTNRPVSMKLKLNENMEMVGGRHPMRADYEVGVTNEGKLNGVKITVYEDQGCSNNESSSGVSTMFIDNAYFCENWHVMPRSCKTNKPSQTACRAPGMMQGIFIMETIMENVAKDLNIDAGKIKKLNFYQKGQVTPIGVKLKYCNISDVTNQLETSSQIKQRFADITTFNAANRWKKRGISMVPMKFGFGWAGAAYSVHVAIFNGDGSVGVAHGGIEMGQGINTKVAQVVAYELNIPIETVHIKANSSLTNANSQVSGGSITSELNCLGAEECCKTLLARMKPVKDKMPPNTKWSDLVAKCYQEGIDLAARFFTNENSRTTEAFLYNSYGATVAEVELDVLTGENQINRVDILYDCGESKNPSIDIGQVEGAFVMGIGYYLLEKMIFDLQTGECLTTGTWEYKPPTTKDIPIDFRINLLKNAPNPLGYLRSKGVSEPPLCMTCAVLFAAKHAVEAARKEIKPQLPYFPLDAPATVEVLQQACLLDTAQYTLG